MADTLNNIDIPPNEWIDLYTESGISVGVQIEVENVGDSDVYLAAQATQPDPDHDAYIIINRNGAPYQNEAADSGAWAFSTIPGSKVNVRIAP